MPLRCSSLRYGLSSFEDLQSAHTEENIGILRFISAPRYDLKLKITLIVQLCQFMIIFPAWSLYVWIKDSRFGPQPECNDLVKYVIVFINVRATVNWLRILTITMLSLCIFSYLLNSPLILRSLKALMKTRSDEDEDEAQEEYTDIQVGCMPICSSVFSVL